MTARPRVLVVDDSAFARTVVSRLLGATGQIEVVGKAHDGISALEQVAALDPDVVTLDLTMPELDGIGVLRALVGRPRPRVIVVSISGVDTELGAEALLLGAVDLVAKPTALASDRLHEIGGELVAKVLAAVGPRVQVTSAATWGARHPIAELVVVGASTGGPQALTRLVAALPDDLRAPLAIALHIPPGYTESLAARLDKMSKLHVVEASQGLVLVRGMIVLARGGQQLRIVRRRGQFEADLSSVLSRAFAPSVDELFNSAAAAAGRAALGVVLTGMGDDGLEGARAIAAAGGALITESAASCVVYGMPRVVDDADLGASSLALDDIGAEIARRV